MTDRLKAHLHDGRGMRKADREALMLDLEDTLEDELYISGQPVRTLARSLKEDDDYYYYGDAR